MRYRLTCQENARGDFHQYCFCDHDASNMVSMPDGTRKLEMRVTGLAYTTQYSFKVEPFNAVGMGEPSEPSVPQADPRPGEAVWTGARAPDVPGRPEVVSHYPQFIH